MKTGSFLGTQCTWVASWMSVTSYSISSSFHIFRSAPPSRPNNIRGVWNVRTCVRTYVRPSTKKFFRFQWNFVCRWRSMCDAQLYAVWPDPKSRSRSRVLESHSRGVDCPSHTALILICSKIIFFVKNLVVVVLLLVSLCCSSGK